MYINHEGFISLEWHKLDFLDSKQRDQPVVGTEKVKLLFILLCFCVGDKSKLNQVEKGDGGANYMRYLLTLAGDESSAGGSKLRVTELISFFSFCSRKVSLPCSIQRLHK